MARSQTKRPRLYCTFTLQKDTKIDLTLAQQHYLLHVLRLGEGNKLHLFNQTQGEWLCELVLKGKKNCYAICVSFIEHAQPVADIDYIFAPIKSARLDYIAQKATEMGVKRLRPVITEYTQNTHVNLERLRANAIEAAEQCLRCEVPEICDMTPLATLLQNWDNTRRLIFCDESKTSQSPISTLNNLSKTPIALLVGPEGGFSEAERHLLNTQPFVTSISLGPRIMRADTAAIAALTLIQATLGDW